MRKHTLLTDLEREQLVGIPSNDDQLARLYTLDRADLDMIRLRRHPRNRLGVALQLAIMRHPGTSLAQHLQQGGSIPRELVAHLAAQLNLSPDSLADYATREQTMTDHARQLAAALNLRGPIRSDVPFLIEAATKASWSTDNGMVIARGIVDALRKAGILLPAVSTIERAGIAGRARARKRAAAEMTQSLGGEQLAALDALLEVDEVTGMVVLTWLKTIPIVAKSDNLRGVLDRLRAVRALKLPSAIGDSVHPDRRRRFVREGRASPAYMIERYAQDRRHAILAAAIHDLEGRLIDAALDMADKLIGGLFRRARNRQERRYASTPAQVGHLMRLFRGTIDALANAVEEGSDPLDAIDEAVGWATLVRARPDVSRIADTAVEDPLVAAGDQYATLRKFAPQLIEALEFRSLQGSARTVKALDLLRELNRSGKRDVPGNAPMPFRKEWRKLVVEPDGKINRHLYETATLAHVRNKLRSGDVWVDRSSSYRRFDSYLIPAAAATPIAKGLGLPDSADEWLNSRATLLDERLKSFERRLRKGQLEGVAMVGDRLRITPISNTTPPDAKALAERLYGLLPRIRVTELLHEVARETGFLSAFTNLRTGRTSDNESALLAAILADATNLGLSRMSAASEGVTRDQLVWAKDAYIRDDCYSAALAHLINAHHVLPFSQVWGHGTTSSSDGQFFRGRKRGASCGDINARYGVDPGFSFYTHVSDQHGPFHAKVISAATHEAPYVLDGLLHHGSVLRIDEHFTDTGGATDHVFALCSMLGFRFCPRLRDFPDRRLVSIAPPGTYPTLAPLLGKRLRIDVVREHWDEIVRLIASTSSGHVLPSAMLRKLAAYERQNQVDLALQEIGKVERTLFMLDWLENPALRRRCHAGLNKSEQRHSLTQAIYTFHQGRVVDRTQEAQQYRASGLNLVIAAIVYWNTVYLSDAVQHLKESGEEMPEQLLAHSSPVGWEHIAFSGDFLWDRAARRADHKPLNLSPDRAA